MSSQQGISWLLHSKLWSWTTHIILEAANHELAPTPLQGIHKA